MEGNRKFKTPLLDKLIDFVNNERLAGNIADGTMESLKLGLIEAINEAADLMIDSYEKNINRVRWQSFVLGVVASIVIAGVALAIMYES